MMMTVKLDFYMLAVVVGLIARRLLIPPSPTGEQIEAVGRAASRWSIGSLLLLFLAGAILLYFVDEKKAKAEAARLS